MKNEKDTGFGGVIRRIRKNKGLTQQDLEKKTGIKRAYIAQIETNKIKNVSIPTLKRLAVGLGVKENELFEAAAKTNYDSSPVFIFTQSRDAKDITPGELREVDKSEKDFLKQVYKEARKKRQNE